VVKVENIPCQTSRRSDSGFLPSKDMYIVNVGTNVGGCILARYFKGIEGDGSNAVIVRITEDE
jgi:hypothetical protein